MLDVQRTMLKENGSYITTIIVADLYNILDPNSADVCEIMQNKQQRNLIYHGFIVKYFPLIPGEGLVQVYDKRDDISFMYPLLKPSHNKLQRMYRLEKGIMDSIYNNGHKASSYITSITKRDIYHITYICGTLKIPSIEIRNAFDAFILSKEYIYAGIKLKIGGHIFWIDKKYAIIDDLPDTINIDRALCDVLYIILNNGTKVQISKNLIAVEVHYNESDRMTFDLIEEHIFSILKPIINSLNRMGILILLEGSKISERNLNMVLNNSIIEARWPENCTSEQFSKLKDVLLRYAEAGILNLKGSGLGSFDISMMTGIACCSPQKTKAILSQVSEMWNQFDYYTIPEVHSRWNDVSRNGICFEQKASNVTMHMTGFSKLEFCLTLPILMGMMYAFSTSTCNTILVKDTEIVTKRLKKLKGIDPDLFSFKTT